LITAVGVLGFVDACASNRTESAYAAQLPADIRPSYELFVKRCSKCHSLSRPLDSGIEDDAYWAIYVRRMRLQPGSGISERDEAGILQFLRYYARERREKKPRATEDAGAVQVVAPPPVTAPPPPASTPTTSTPAEGEAPAPSSSDASGPSNP
jgi:hypothetical protein